MENSWDNLSETNCNEMEAILPNNTGRILCMLFLFFIAGVTISGNVFLILKVTRRGQFERKINVFLISLAIADFSIGFLVMPFSIIHNFTETLFFRNTVTINIFFALDAMLTISSIFHFTCMNIDRYVAVKKPMKYYQIMKRKLVSLTLIICWTISCLASVVLILTAKEGTCNPSVEGEATVIVSVLAFYFPLVLNISASVSIYLKVRNRSNQLRQMTTNENIVLQSKRQNGDTQVARTMIILQSCFILCFTPFFLFLILKNFFRVEFSPWSMLFVTWLAYTNSTINPFLYYFINNRLKLSDKNKALNKDRFQFTNNSSTFNSGQDIVQTF
ncbi:5-hydroxytryptamine receptor 4-like [Saccostrea cucullata]|uniref:5-hydroxytryptamine receptor 4-like n=1 Tax=Saccostrea cuccullata TaxID=36930 RepID=UPI002ED2C84A